MTLSPAELLLAYAPDAVIFADAAGTIRHWNSAAARVFGHDAEAAIGESLNIIVPEGFREAHWSAFERAIATGETKYAGQALPTRSMRADGEAIYVELTFAIVKDDDGVVVGALAHARDITERWGEQRAQRGRIRDLEAQVHQLGGTPGEA